MLVEENLLRVKLKGLSFLLCRQPPWHDSSKDLVFHSLLLPSIQVPSRLEPSTVVLRWLLKLTPVTQLSTRQNTLINRDLWLYSCYRREASDFCCLAELLALCEWIYSFSLMWAASWILRVAGHVMQDSNANTVTGMSLPWSPVSGFWHPSPPPPSFPVTETSFSSPTLSYLTVALDLW